MIESRLLKKLNMPKQDLLSWKVHRKSVDARGSKVLFSFVIDADVRHESRYLRHKDVTITPDEKFRFDPAGTLPLEHRPVVVGFGPAGLFAALLLAQYGYNPLIIERGAPIERRSADVKNFWEHGQLNPESNVQFGMGGAGAFSDGKLTTRSKDLRSRKIFDELVAFGAPQEILYEKHPHVGTDGFVAILKNARAEIERLGGTFLWDTRLEKLQFPDGRLEAIEVMHNGQQETIPCNALILAIGHSASDTIRALHTQGVKMEQKPFAIGVRIEHDQKFINKAMLKDRAFDPALIPARYQLSMTASNGKGVYTFCMCPGGYVIPSSSQPETVVVNGMSYANRAGENANAALLVQATAQDMGEGTLAGLKLQDDLEKAAYAVSHSYKAPAQLARDFVDGKVSTGFGQVQPTYALGTVFANFNDLLPFELAKALKEGLIDFEKRVPGFLDDAIMTGLETRSSSAVRLVRDGTTLQSNIIGLYPCGEGAGYAGGIMTSAIDGLKCAMALMDTFDKPANLSVQ